MVGEGALSHSYQFWRRDLPLLWWSLGPWVGACSSALRAISWLLDPRLQVGPSLLWSVFLIEADPLKSRDEDNIYGCPGWESICLYNVAYEWHLLNEACVRNPGSSQLCDPGLATFLITKNNTDKVLMRMCMRMCVCV